MMSHHYRTWAATGGVPPDAGVVMAHLDLLKATAETEGYARWLKAALEAENAKADNVNGLKVYQALTLRREGKKAEGLALLQEVAKGLTVREANEEEAKRVRHAPAPFVLACGETIHGTVSSRADARLVWETMGWLTGLEGAVPAPDGLDEDALRMGFLALAGVLSRAQDAAPWLVAYRDAVGEPFGWAEDVFAEGLVIAAAGDAQEGARKLLRIVRSAPFASFAPVAGVRAHEIAKAAGDDALASQCAQLTLETFGTRLHSDLRERLK